MTTPLLFSIEILLTSPESTFPIISQLISYYSQKQRVQQLYILFVFLFIILIILDHRTLLDG